MEVEMGKLKVTLHIRKNLTENLVFRRLSKEKDPS